METIEIVIDTRGEVRMTTKGFKGAACQAATKPFEDVLGGKTTETLTGEYYEKPIENKLKVGGGR